MLSEQVCVCVYIYIHTERERETRTCTEDMVTNSLIQQINVMTALFFWCEELCHCGYSWKKGISMNAAKRKNKKTEKCVCGPASFAW